MVGAQKQDRLGFTTLTDSRSRPSVPLSCLHGKKMSQTGAPPHTTPHHATPYHQNSLQGTTGATTTPPFVDPKTRASV